MPLFENIDAERIIDCKHTPATISNSRDNLQRGCRRQYVLYFIGALSKSEMEQLLWFWRVFCEIALLKETPRVATVAANSFCELLVLRKGDFEELVKSPQLKEEIEKVAAARLS